MKSFIYPLIGLAIILSSLSVQAKTYSITSPDGQIEITIKPGALSSYSVRLSGHPLLQDAQAQLTIQGNDNLDAKVTKVSRNTVRRKIQPHIRQKSQFITEHYNEIKFELANRQSLTFRVFDQGFGYRFSSLETGELIVESEQARLNFTENHKLYFPQENSFVSHNERAYLQRQLMDISSKQFASLPLLVETPNAKLVITETGLRDYPGMWLRGTGQEALSAIFPAKVLKSELKEGSDRNENILKRAGYLSHSKVAKEDSGRDFPWRVFAIAKNDAELLTNQLSYLLADETAIAEPSWIKPGQVAWDWWNANNIYNVNFKAGINTQTYRHYIDFAAKYGIEYIIMDEGWYHLGNVLNVVDDIDVKEIISYGKSKNVDVILWVIWETLDQQMELALDTFASWGAAGIKVDFMQRDDQDMVNYYWKVAKEAAERRLLVNFHGSYKPAGLRRAYPNVITREGVRGLEHNKWADYITAEHNLTLPFIRMLAGPMDYTPGAMTNSQPKNFKIIFDRPMSKTTRVHQMAMYVIFESPLQMLADSPSNYLKEHQSTAFISQIPTVWDETKILSAKLADHIITARRSGTDWFIGIMGNGQARDFTLDLSFLAAGNHQMTSFADGINADSYASDHKVSSQTINSSDKLKVKLAPNGGWVAKISKSEDSDTRGCLSLFNNSAER